MALGIVPGGNAWTSTTWPSRKIVRKSTRLPNLTVETTYFDLPDVDSVKCSLTDASTTQRQVIQLRKHNVVANPPLRILPASMKLDITSETYRTIAAMSHREPSSGLQKEELTKRQDKDSFRRHSGPSGCAATQRSFLLSGGRRTFLNGVEMDDCYLRATSQTPKTIERMESLPPLNRCLPKLANDNDNQSSMAPRQFLKRVHSLESNHSLELSQSVRKKSVDEGNLKKEITSEAEVLQRTTDSVVKAAPLMLGRDPFGRKEISESRLLKVVESQRFKTLRSLKGLGDYVIIVKINEQRWPCVEFKASISAEEKEKLVETFIKTEKLKRLVANGLLKVIDKILKEVESLKRLKRLRRVRLSESKEVYSYDCDVIDLIE